jgi:hypothetical protein
VVVPPYVATERERLSASFDDRATEPRFVSPHDIPEPPTSAPLESLEDIPSSSSASASASASIHTTKRRKLSETGTMSTSSYLSPTTSGRHYKSSSHSHAPPPPNSFAYAYRHRKSTSASTVSTFVDPDLLSTTEADADVDELNIDSVPVSGASTPSLAAGGASTKERKALGEGFVFGRGSAHPRPSATSTSASTNGSGSGRGRGSRKSSSLGGGGNGGQGAKSPASAKARSRASSVSKNQGKVPATITTTSAGSASTGGKGGEVVTTAGGGAGGSGGKSLTTSVANATISDDNMKRIKYCLSWLMVGLSSPFFAINCYSFLSFPFVFSFVFSRFCISVSFLFIYFLSLPIIFPLRTRAYSQSMHGETEGGSIPTFFSSSNGSPFFSFPFRFLFRFRCVCACGVPWSLCPICRLCGENLWVITVQVPSMCGHAVVVVFHSVYAMP